MISRMVDYATQLEPEVDFWVSVDQTTPEAMTTAARIVDAFDEHGLESRRLNIHRFCEAELEDTYPGLLELRDRLPNGYWDIPGADGIRSLAWLFHTETLGLWLRSLRNSNVYEFVWVFEDDVGYSDNVSELVDAYAQDPDDLISGMSISAPSPPYSPQGATSTGWYWYYTITRAFKDRVPPELRFVSQEFVQRISLRLLKEAEKWCREGASAVSEMLVPTVAFSSGMHVSVLRPEHLGLRFHYTGHVDEDDWQKVMTSGQPGRLYHPLKF